MKKIFHIKTLIQYYILLQGDLREVFIQNVITKWGCEADAVCEGCVAAGVLDAGMHHEESPVMIQATLAVEGMVRTGVAPTLALLLLRLAPEHLDIQAVVAEVPTLRLPDVAGLITAAPNMPIVPITLLQVHRKVGMPHAGTIVSVPPILPFPLASDCCYADLSQKAVVVIGENAAQQALTPSSP